MATASTKSKAGKPVRRTGKPGRPKADGRLNNRGVVGNKGGGDKPWQPDRMAVDGVVQTQDQAWADARALVRHMAAVGVPHETMCNFVKPMIRDVATLKKHFAWELENGKWQADLNVMGTAYRMAVSGRHEGMTRWWGSRRVEGFGDKVDLNLNTPIPVQMLPGDEDL